MKRIFNAFLALAMVITAGMSLTSCTSNDDNPTTPQNPLAQQLVGEWINEYDYSGTGDILIVTIYHFYDDGTCWKELNLRQGNEVFDQTDSRYATSQSTYTIDASGRVVMTVRDADRGTEETEVLTFDGTHLSVTYVEKPIIMVRATDAQIRFYQAESDALHGGSDGGSDDGGVAEGHPFSESVVGEIVGSDGLAYAVADKDRLPEGVSAVAMVAYRSETRGLAIQLVSKEPEKKTWDEAKNYVKSLAPVPGAQWFIPSKTDWKDMLVACANKAMVSDNDIANAFDFFYKMTLTGVYKFMFPFKCWMNEGPEALPTVVGLGDVFGVATFESVKETTYSCMACLVFLEGHPLSESAVGEIVGSDGKAYAVADKDYVPYGVSAAAMVAYKDGSNGLAIALTDEPEDMDWNTANGPSGAAAHTPAVAGQTWKLPSLEDFRQMFISTDGDALQSWVMNRNLTLAGGTPLKASLQDNAGYWMSSEWEGDVASHMRHFDNHVGYNRMSKDIVSSVRACFAF